MTNEERIKESCRFIEAHSDEALTLVALAKRASMSQFHFQRSFKALIGVTPKQYHDAHRLKNFKSQLKASDDITQAVFNAGYSSASRVYQNVDTRLGMTPREYRASGKGVHITYVSFETPLGLMMIGATDRGLCFAQFGETHAQLEEVLRAEYRGAMVQPMHEPRDPRLALWIEALRQHLSGTNPALICRSTSALRRFNSASGSICSAFRMAKSVHMQKWREQSATPKPRVPWPEPAQVTCWRLLFRVIA